MRIDLSAARLVATHVNEYNDMKEILYLSKTYVTVPFTKVDNSP